MLVMAPFGIKLVGHSLELGKVTRPIDAVRCLAEWYWAYSALLF